jgi:hypothetical protein
MKKVMIATLAAAILSATVTPLTASQTRTRDCDRFLGQTSRFILLPIYLSATGHVASEFFETLKLWHITKNAKPDDEIISTAAKLLADLDAAEQKMNEGRIQIGNCYGKGSYGAQAAKNYEAAISAITKLRQRILDQKQSLLERNFKARDLESAVQKWRAKYTAVLSKSLPDAEIVIEKIYTEELGHEFRNTVFDVSVMNKGPGVILRPYNAMIYGFDADSPGVGGTSPLGAVLSDSFGNTFVFNRVRPEFYGTGSKGIRPGETVDFSFSFADTPVPNSSYVVLSLEAKSVGQERPVAFRLPADAFFSSPTVKK